MGDWQTHLWYGVGLIVVIVLVLGTRRGEG